MGRSAGRADVNLRKVSRVGPFRPSGSSGGINLVIDMIIIIIIIMIIILIIAMIILIVIMKITNAPIGAWN